MAKIPKGDHMASPALNAVKEEALMIVATTLRDELARRIQDGSLVKEFQGMRITQLTFQLNKLAEVLKGPAVAIALNLPAPQNPQLLHDHSALNLTPRGRMRLHTQNNRRRAIEGTVVKPAIPAIDVLPENPGQPNG